MIGLAKKFLYISILCVASLGWMRSVADAASMSLTVAQQSVAKGDTFVVEWYLNTEGVPINVVDATLYYSPETLVLQDAVTGSSVLSLWIEKPHIVEPGTIRLVGGIPAGVRGSKIPIVRTVFRATSTGRASIALGKDSKVVHSDGIATSAAISMTPVVFPVVPESASIVSSPTHPHQDRWYSATTAQMVITEKNPVVYSLSTNPEITPSGTPAVVTEPLIYESLQDGIYYFKVAAPVDGALQELQTFRILIDHTAPIISSATIDLQSEVFDGAASLSMYAVDKMSGVAFIKVKTGWFGLYHETTTPYRLHKPLFGNVVRIQVSDKAGNTALSTLYFRGYLANWVSYCVTLGVLVWILIMTVRKRNRIRLITKKILQHLFLQRRSDSSLS